MNTEEMLSFMKRRGFLWPSSEIYGGAQGLYDYGPVGTAVKRRLEEAWASWFVGLSPDYYLIEPAEILPEAVVRASGHLANFTDLKVTCRKCGADSRADVLLEEHGVRDVEGLPDSEISDLLRERNIRCPRCGEAALGEPQRFNLMFGVDFGPTGRERAYFRPETAQGAYLAFARMWEVARKRLPFGVAVIGKAYRNEIAPRQVLFRLRAFTQAELQIFFDPEDFPVPWEPWKGETVPVLRAEDRARGETSARPYSLQDLVQGAHLPPFYAFHLLVLYRFFTHVLGHPDRAIRFQEKNEKERAFYNRIHMDLEVELPSLGGFKELGALHYRGDYDLRRHGEGSGQDLSVTTVGGKKVLPHVLELTFGVDRNLWGLLERHLSQDMREGEEPRTVLRMPPYLAPALVGVLPLIRKEHGELSRGLARELRSQGIPVVEDATQSIGRRYARQDEIGIPFAVTVDGETLRDRTVTIRDRDTRSQVRVPLGEVAERLRPHAVFPRWPGDEGAPASVAGTGQKAL